MPRVSAGLLMYRIQEGQLQVLLGHPGGPFWKGKDAGAWSIPKGELDDPDENPLAAARREFRQETGLEPPADPYIALGSVRQKAGKVVHGWAFEGDCDTSAPPPSNTFRLEWPFRSGRWIVVPELDRMEFFEITEARRRINPAQAELLDRLAAALGMPGAVGE